jgi:hypothetical protein
VIELEFALLSHLDAQLSSVGRLREVVGAQGEAIRLRDAETVVALTAELQNELQRRRVLEEERARLLIDSAGLLAMPPAEVTLEHVCGLIPEGAAAAARERSARLRSELAEVAAEHELNRALMRQELLFLSHLTRLLADEPQPGYLPPSGARTAARPRTSILDLEA